MKTADVVIGEAYAYTQWLHAPRDRSGYRLNEVNKFVATGTEQVKERVQSSYGKYRTVTKIVGEITYRPSGSTATIKVNARNLVSLWAPIEQQAIELAAWEAKAKAAEAERIAQNAPMLKALYRVIRDKTGVDLPTNEYRDNEAVRKGMIEVPIDVLYRAFFGS